MPLQYRFFRIPARDPGPWETELNRFLGSVRVARVHRGFVDDGANSFWTLTVEYMQKEPNEPAGENARKKPKVDYKALLSPEDFAVYARLREWRKTAAADENAPIYAVFTNDQLAKIAQKRVRTKADLLAIDGVGESRAGKHGEAVFRIVAEAATDAPNGAAE